MNDKLRILEMLKEGVISIDEADRLLKALEKEPDNEYDKEAIKVTYEGLGKIGYVANSSYTVIGDSMSAGRIYDKIGKKAKAKVVLVTEHGTICSISKKSLLDNQKKVKKSETEVEE